MRCSKRLPRNGKLACLPPTPPTPLLVFEPSSPSQPPAHGAGGWLGKKGQWRSSGSIIWGLHKAWSEAAPHVLWTAWLHQPAYFQFCFFFVTERKIVDRKYKVLQVQGKQASFLSGLLRKMSSRDRGRPLATEFLQKILSEVSRKSKENGFCVRPKNRSLDGVIIPSPCLLACVVKWHVVKIFFMLSEYKEFCTNQGGLCWAGSCRVSSSVVPHTGRSHGSVNVSVYMNVFQTWNLLTEETCVDFSPWDLERQQA